MVDRWKPLVLHTEVGSAGSDQLVGRVAQIKTREGDARLSGSEKSSPAGGSSSRSDKKRKGVERSGTVGRALKTVYDEMLREDVPKDFLDLLGKLD